MSQPSPPTVNTDHAYSLAAPGSDRLLRSCVLVLMCVLLAWSLTHTAWAGRHMLLHVFLMTLVAPVIARTLQYLFRTPPEYMHLPKVTSTSRFWTVTGVQLLLFLFWHSPGGMLYGMTSPKGTFVLQISLLAIAVVFWWQLLHLPARKKWHGVLALLLTGKIFCLVAILMTFAPRSLYPGMAVDEQQLAGLIMITLCPLCYIASGLYLFWRWLHALEGHSATDGRTGREAMPWS